ncbi:MAG TPA: hypothetical protein VE010_19950 [Thermoanaerobaculia bacterium]|nr:hypothetical protein [Thermoanaerobaculia bacterium]
MLAAALLLLSTIQCVDSEFDRFGAAVHYSTHNQFVAVPPPALRGTRRHRVGALSVYAGHVVEQDGFIGDHRLLRLYLERGGRWWQLQHGGAALLIDDEWSVRFPHPAEPIVIERARGELIRISYGGRVLSGGLTTNTLLVDGRAERPQIKVSIECAEVRSRGACSAPAAAHDPRAKLECDDNLQCTKRDVQWVDWSTREATRRFDLLTRAHLPPRVFDAATYASGAAYARAFAADRNALEQRVIIDRIGRIYPVFELSRNEIVFAALPKQARAGARFFLLTRDPVRWTEIAQTWLTDAGYPAKPSEDELRAAAPPLGNDLTVIAPQPLFFADRIEYNGKGRLLEVVVREGEARSLHWLMFDPNGRSGAIRLATDRPEYRYCADELYPPSITSIGIPDEGLPAHVTAISSWRMKDLVERKLPKRCPTVGRIGWSATKGWTFMLGQSPCTKPTTQPLATGLTDAGTLAAHLVKPER